MKTNSMSVDLNPIILMTTLIIICISMKWKDREYHIGLKGRPNYILYIRNPFSTYRHRQVKSEMLEYMDHKTGEDILILDEVEFRTGNITRN